jgi:hypothetical protein
MSFRGRLEHEIAVVLEVHEHGPAIDQAKADAAVGSGH